VTCPSGARDAAPHSSCSTSWPSTACTCQGSVAPPCSAATAFASASSSLPSSVDGQLIVKLPVAQADGLVAAGLATRVLGGPRSRRVRSRAALCCAFLAAKDHLNLFLYDGAIVPDPEGIITGGHNNCASARTPTAATTPAPWSSFSSPACTARSSQVDSPTGRA